MDKDCLPDQLSLKKPYYKGAEELVRKGHSTIIDPHGELVAEPVCAVVDKRPHTVLEEL